MPTIKFRPHSVVTYYNGSREAVAVDFTPTISFDLDEFKREADRQGATYNVHEENIYIIGASQALMVVFDKNPDEVEIDIRMAVRALELEEE